MNDSPKFLSAVPVLPAADLTETIAFYMQRLGFALEFHVDESAGVCRGGAHIHLWSCQDRAIAENTSCRVNVAGIDHLYEEYQTQQVIHPHGELAEKPWGTREFTALDLNGNALTFTEAVVSPEQRRRDRTD